MIDLAKLYQMAEEENIEVDCFDLNKREALSLMDEDGQCFIAIDPFKLHSVNDERQKLAHELGHCITGSFYNKYAAADCRQRHENRADKWAIRQLIPADDFLAAISSGLKELWELAEHFSVSEQFMQKAVCYYTHGNLATNLYFYA